MLNSERCASRTHEARVADEALNARTRVFVHTHPQARAQTRTQTNNARGTCRRRGPARSSSCARPRSASSAQTSASVSNGNADRRARPSDTQTAAREAPTASGSSSAGRARACLGVPRDLRVDDQPRIHPLPRRASYLGAHRTLGGAAARCVRRRGAVACCVSCRWAVRPDDRRRETDTQTRRALVPPSGVGLI
jgi:hypothetical protein